MGQQTPISTIDEIKMKPHETLAQLNQLRQQATIEFNRYKQDCRKRALEMAHHELINLTAASQASRGGEINVTELADKYYNWLISIPNE